MSWFTWVLIALFITCVIITVMLVFVIRCRISVQTKTAKESLPLPLGSAVVAIPEFRMSTNLVLPVYNDNFEIRQEVSREKSVLDRGKEYRPVEKNIEIHTEETVPQENGVLPESRVVEEVQPVNNNFTVVCYNVRCDVDKPPHDWNSRKRHVVANIARHKPSIVCLQESTESVKQYICSQGSYEGCGSYRDHSYRSEAAHVLFDPKQWRLVKHQTFVFGDGGLRPCPVGACTSRTAFAGVKAKHTRVFTHVVLRALYSPGLTDVHVINTHFPVENELQEGCAAQLAEYAASLTGPVIVTGDFNSHYSPTRHSSPLQTIIQRGQLLDAHGLQDLPTFGPFHKLKRKVHKLDYVLYRNLSLVQAGISDYRYGPTSLRPSDHEALFSTFLA
jgi:endonuclease/exonuclease/phosphatase family metal-dependent hydrolase